MKRVKITMIKPNKLFESWLEEWRNEAAAQNSELQYHFSKALEALKKYPLPLETGKDCIILQHFGNKLCTMIDKKLEQHLSVKSDQIDANENQNDIQQDMEIDHDLENQQIEKDMIVISDDDDLFKNRINSQKPRKSLNDENILDEPFDMIDQEHVMRPPNFIIGQQNFDIILLVDTQEVKGADRTEAVTGQLSREGINFEIRHLHVGDFIWIARCKHSQRELVLPYVVERKRIDDLASSIKDGRYHEQKFRLKQSGIYNIIYMIEKLNNGNTHSSIPLTTLMQAAINSLIQDGFLIKFTRSHRDSMLYLSTFTKTLEKIFKNKLLKECDKEDLPKNFNITSDEMFLIEFDKFNKTSAKVKVMKVKDMFVKQLIQIKGLSLDATLAIVSNYPTPLLLKKAFDDAGDNGEKLLSNLQYGRTKRKLGPTMSKTIFQLYTKKELN